MAETLTIEDTQTGQQFEAPAGTPYDSQRYKPVASTPSPDVAIRDKQSGETFSGPAGTPYDPARYETVAASTRVGAKKRKYRLSAESC